MVTYLNHWATCLYKDYISAWLGILFLAFLLGYICKMLWDKESDEMVCADSACWCMKTYVNLLCIDVPF